jgi:hypothetical protein
MIPEILRDMATFIKDNYEPWKELPEDNILLYLTNSFKEGTLIPLIGGFGEKTEILAVFQYWNVTRDYIRRARFSTNGLPTPTQSERSGDIMLFPITVISERFADAKITQLLNRKIWADYPDIEGYYRYVLRNGSIRFVKRTEGGK